MIDKWSKTMLDACFHFEHDPYRCGKFKLAPWSIGDKCLECLEFIFINWEAIDLPRKRLRKLFVRMCDIID